MNKKNTKVLSGVLATTLGLGSVMGATTVLADTVEQLYKAAFTATQEAQSKKTQEAINVARKAVRELDAALKDNKDLKAQLIGTLSGMLDPLQQDKFKEFYAIIYKEDNVTEKEKLSQEEINKAIDFVESFKGAYVVDTEEYKSYIGAWSSKVDKLQQANTNATVTLVEKALKSKTVEDVKAARESLSELLKTKNKDTKEFAQGFDIQLAKVEKELAEAAKILSVKTLEATGVRTLKVTFNKAVEDTKKLTLNVKRDDVKVTVKEITWNDAKTEATITASYDLQDGKYSIESVYDKEAATKVENVEVKAAVLNKIEFANDYAVISDDGLEVQFNIKATNQYGEDITNKLDSSELNCTSSKGEQVNVAKGVVTLRTKATDEYKVDGKLVITLVHKQTSAVATKTLTVTKSANISKFTFGEITTDNSNYKGKDIRASYIQNIDSGFYVPMTAVDQYGNALNKDQLNAVTVLTSNDRIVNAKIDTINNKTVLKLSGAADSDKQITGTAIITVVSTNGISANVKVTVFEDGKIDVLKLQQPETQLKGGVETDIPFQAVDQYGTELTNADQLKIVIDQSGKKATINGKTTITVSNGVLKTYIDYANGKKVSLAITPDKDESTVILTVITSTGKVQNVNWNVSATPMVASIKGFSKKFYNKMQAGQIQGLSSLLQFNDQYGNYKASSKDVLGNVNFKIEDLSKNKCVIYDSVNKNFTTGKDDKNNDIIGKTNFKVVLSSNDTGKILDEYEFTMESVAKKDITEFGVSDFGKQYTGAVSKDHNQVTKIYGKKDGVNVLVDQKMIKQVSVSDGISSNGSTIGIFEGTPKVPTSGADKKATVTVVIEAAETIVVKKELVYSDATPKASSLKVFAWDDYTDDPVIGVSSDEIGDAQGNITNTENDGLYFEVVDQYGVYSDDVKYFITNVNDANNNFEAKIVNGNKITLSDADGLAGNEFTINAITSTGLSKSIKVILQGGANINVQ